MKVAVSIPDDLFAEADRVAFERGASRSALYAEALSVFLRAQSPERITMALDAAVARIKDCDGEFRNAAAGQVLAGSEW